MTSPESASSRISRIIDANFNRLSEGLRILEEIARLAFDDLPLTQQLKTLRHELVISDLALNRRLIQSRQADSDIGSDMNVAGEEKSRELPLLLVANSRRAQEALRVLEELAGVPGSGIESNSDKYRRARFILYTIEQKLLAKLTGSERLKHISGLYVIIDTAMLGNRSHTEVASQVINGGARTIQLRDKLRGKREILETARRLQKVCAENDTLFIVNDYPDIAMAADAGGVHLGQDDLPVSTVRRLMPPGRIIGCSTTSVEQAKAAEAEGADYIAVGAIYPTSSKTSTTTPAKVVGTEMLRRVREAVTVPLVAIGSINEDNADEVIKAGADSVAVIGAVLGADSLEDAARRIASKFKAG